jgi:hypothetical protein
MKHATSQAISGLLFFALLLCWSHTFAQSGCSNPAYHEVVDASGWAAGVYWVEVISGTLREQAKVVVQR